jgi:hypothetical protein
MKRSDWFTGRLFEAMGGPKWPHVANTAGLIENWMAEMERPVWFLSKTVSSR